MFTNTARFLPVALLVLGSASARDDTPAIVTKARAYLGSNAALDAVKSVHFTGSVTAADNSKAVIEIIFQKPYQQRITATTDKNIETTALDNYDGWRRLQETKDSSRWQLTLLSKDQIKRLRANTWENLAYFSGMDRGGVKLEELGDATAEGVACRKVAFRHADDIVFFRYFDQATGRLVLTETETGGSIREEGEIMVNGIRFPKKVITASKERGGKDGKEINSVSITVFFEKITLNEKFAASSFAIPAFSAKGR
ncbi:MAG: hypothetical protein EXS39_01915 [Opitutaceae bacterium]|nr:hypothetical protein [Opitutaceae bacterium]